MFRPSFTAFNVTRAMLLVAAVSISACSGAGSQLVADARCRPAAAPSPYAAECLQVPNVNVASSDASRSAFARPGVYYDP